MPQYTIALEYDGCFLIAQVFGSTPKASVETWIQTLDREFGHVIGPTRCKTIQEGFETAYLIKRVEDLENVWCAVSRIEGQLAVAHIIWTVSEV